MFIENTDKVRSEQNYQFADYTSKYIFLNKNIWIFIKIVLMFDVKGH